MALNPRQLAILQSVKEQGSVKTEELAEEFGITLQTARRDIQRLTEAAELERFHGGVRAVDSPPATSPTPNANAPKPAPSKTLPGKWPLPFRTGPACS
jgi:DeoR/GlpR family transcriptional regulator of sugar metabolism